MVLKSNKKWKGFKINTNFRFSNIIKTNNNNKKKKEWFYNYFYNVYFTLIVTLHYFIILRFMLWPIIGILFLNNVFLINNEKNRFGGKENPKIG